MKPHDVLVVGCGNIAGRFDLHRGAGDLPLTHAGAFSRNPAFRLAACVEPDVARREAFMARWNVPLGFASLESARSAGIRPGVVSICSPTANHPADLESAIALAPRLVFCEKPLCPVLGDSEQAVAACERAGIQLAVNYTRRWAPDVIEFKQQIDSGRWGAIRSISGLYSKGILNNGGHMIDLALYLAGPMDVVDAVAQPDDWLPEDPTLSALLRTRSGIAVTLAGGHAADYSVFELQIVAQEGVVVMENGGMTWRLRSPAPSNQFSGYRALGAPVERPGLYDRAMTAAVENIRAALAEGEPLRSDGRSALETHRVCAGLIQASQRHPEAR